VPEIILLALGSAMFPTLLACVIILLARPNPRRLLLAFYVGCISMSLVCGTVVLVLFDDGDSAAGSTPSTPHPWSSLLDGVLAMALAWLMISGRAGRTLERARAWRQRRRPEAQAKREGPSWVERRLDRATAWLAFVIGAAINLPGPLYILGLGRISKGGYGVIEQAALVLVFNLIMFVLLEVPLIGYVVSPESTATRVAAFGTWLNANGIRVMGAFVGLFGVSLVVQGLGALL
jgi:hypothetical protein